MAEDTEPFDRALIDLPAMLEPEEDANPEMVHWYPQQHRSQLPEPMRVFTPAGMAFLVGAAVVIGAVAGILVNFAAREGVKRGRA